MSNDLVTNSYLGAWDFDFLWQSGKRGRSKFNEFIFPLVEGLGLEKQEGEKQAIFESRLYSELSKILDVELI